MSKFNIEAVFKAIDRFSGPVGKMTSRVERMSRRTSGSLDKINAMSSKALGGLKGLAAYAPLGIAAAGGMAAASVVTTGASFEQAITNVGAVGLKTRAEIKDLETEAKRLGATTRFTATEAAQGMEIMAKAGFESAEILAGVDGVLSASAASGMEMADVASHISSVMKGMGLSATDAETGLSNTTKIADVLALASSKTNSTIGTLGESMANVSATASQLGVPLHEAVAAVASLQDVGLDASVAGSALNTMLTKLSAPTDALSEKLSGLGVEFKDGVGNMLPFMDVIRNLSKAAEKSGGNMDQVAILAELVGLRGQKAAMSLTKLFNDPSRKLHKLTDALQNANGEARKMAELRMNTTTGSWQLLMSAVDAVQTNLFELNGGALKKTLDSLTAWVTKSGPDMVAGVERFFTMINDNMPTIKEWTGRIWRVIKVFGTLAIAAKALSVVFAIMSAVNPITAIIVGLALLVAFWPEVVAGFEYFWGAIVSGWNIIAAEVSEFMEEVATVFKAGWNILKSDTEELWNSVVGYAVGAYDRVIKAWSAVTGFFSGLWKSITEAFNSILGPVFEKIGGAVELIKGVGGSVADAFSGGLSPSGGGAVSASDRVAASFSESISRQEVALTISDPSSRATVKSRGGTSSRAAGRLRLAPTGAF